MKKIVLGILGLLVLAVLVVCGLALTQPDSFQVERSIAIAAPPEKVFPLVDDFHSWNAWSPWDKLDPNMQRTHSGAPRGKGAVYEWKGNDDVGQGRMEVTESTAPSEVVVDLQFISPFEARNLTRFAFAPEGAGTKVRWTMSGENSFMGKVMCVFMDMDKMIGKDFEQGLANMKAAAEKP